MGGALQVASAFILQVLRDPQDIEWAIATSPASARELERFGVRPSAQ